MTNLQLQLLDALKNARNEELIGVEVHRIMRKAKEIMTDEEISEVLGMLPTTSLVKGEDIVYTNAMNAMGYAGW